jgi:hypothetical protein
MKTAVRSRWFLTIAVLMLIGSALPLTGQGGRAQERNPPFGGAGPTTSWADATRDAGDFSAAFIQVGQEGVVGDVILPPDTVDEPGGDCATNRTVSPATMAIGVNLPQVAVAGSSAQAIRFHLGLWQVLPDGSSDYVGGAITDPVVINPGERTEANTFTIGQVPVGPRWLAVITIQWYDDVNAEPTGWLAYQFEYLGTWINRTGEWEFVSAGRACPSLVNPVASLSPTSGIVNTAVAFKLFYFPVEVPVAIQWDAKSLGTVQTDFYARASGAFKVPDGQVMGDHTVSFVAGNWKATRVFTVKPRIKVTPGTVERGEQVKISLRGYRAYEPVKIRWRDGTGSWREIARLTTSGTGSGQVYLPVPLFAPDGPNSVRGDSLVSGGGRAQTNAVTVTGGPVQAAAAPSTPPATPTPTPTATVAASASPTAETTSTATATPPAEPTMEPTTEPTVEPTTAPTEEPTSQPTVEPTTEPTSEPTAESTAQPTADTEGDANPTVEGGANS